MKTILETGEKLHHLKREIISQENKSVNSLKRLNAYAHFQELAEITNEISGINFLKSKNGIIFPQPELIDGCDYFRFQKSNEFSNIVDGIDFRHRKNFTLEKLCYLRIIENDLRQGRISPEDAINECLVLMRSILDGQYDLVLVSGPISTGTKSVEHNLRVFNKAIFGLSEMKFNVVNQMPFGGVFSEIHKKSKDTDFFINEFYHDIMTEDKKFGIKNIFQLPNWRHSRGAVREYNIALEVGIRINQIPFEIKLPSSMQVFKSQSLFDN